MNGAEAIIEHNIGQGGSGGVSNEGTFTIYAGIIQNNTAIGASSGGGVSNGGIFTMHDGTIRNNTVTGERGGGGVSNGGTFNMKGGTIKGNKVLGTSNSYQRESGGGVLVGGSFNMTGGIIGGNDLSDANTAAGGGANANGVCVNLGTFTMSGGIITGNIASGTNNYGVSVVRNMSNGFFTMTGAALVSLENAVFLNPNTKPFTTLIIGGALDNSPAANIIYGNPNTPPNVATALVQASSSETIAANYDKFLYNGVPNHIDSTPVLELTPIYAGTYWYGVYK
jgi:hypothetical protein